MSVIIMIGSVIPDHIPYTHYKTIESIDRFKGNWLTGTSPAGSTMVKIYVFL